MKVFNLNSKLGLVVSALVTIANLTTGLSAFADTGGDHSGGGNFTGLDAAAILKLVPQKLSALGSDLVTSDQLRAITTLATSSSSVVAVSPVPIPVDVAGVIQKSSAYTVGGQNSAVILIYQGDWDAHKSSFNEEVAFMTHEACVAFGIEQTGKYGAVSAELLNRLNAAPQNAGQPVSKRAFDHPLVNAEGYPGSDSAPSWTWAYGFRPILSTSENARSFCFEHGYNNYDPTSLQHETFSATGINGTPIVADVRNSASQFDPIPNNGLYRGEIISSITCVQQ